MRKHFVIDIIITVLWYYLRGNRYARILRPSMLISRTFTGAIGSGKTMNLLALAKFKGISAVTMLDRSGSTVFLTFWRLPRNMEITE
ncbi:MAG: hypothetical protein ACPLSJ_02410 [Thermosulfidibacteraceae bacterium]